MLMMMLMMMDFVETPFVATPCQEKNGASTQTNTLKISDFWLMNFFDSSAWASANTSWQQLFAVDIRLPKTSRE